MSDRARECNCSAGTNPIYTHYFTCPMAGAAPSLDTAQQDQPKEGDIATLEDNFGYEDIVPNRCAKCGEICGLKHVCASPNADAARIGEIRIWFERLPHSPWNQEDYFRFKTAALANIPYLLAEMERREKQWCEWGIVEVAARNPQVAEFCAHWEKRTELAETTASNGLDEIRRLVAETERLRSLNAELVKSHNTLLIDGERLRGERDALQKQLVDMEVAFEKDLYNLRTK